MKRIEAVCKADASVPQFLTGLWFHLIFHIVTPYGPTL